MLGLSFRFVAFGGFASFCDFSLSFPVNWPAAGETRKQRHFHKLLSATCSVLSKKLSDKKQIASLVVYPKNSLLQSSAFLKTMYHNTFPLNQRPTLFAGHTERRASEIYWKPISPTPHKVWVVSLPSLCTQQCPRHL